ncbi:MAG: hypothetical protein HYY06_15490 [Deltaproteobacteria bacterium]|nr:hypothetical protein [Deltaproteobacteria bacterium]
MARGHDTSSLRDAAAPPRARRIRAAVVAAAMALGSCASAEVASLTFALGAESLPEGTEAVSVVVIHANELGFGCLGPSATLPSGGGVSSSAELVCAVDPDCAGLADGDVIEPIPVFRREEMESDDGVTIEDVPEGPALVFLEAYDADENTVGIGCATTSVKAGATSLVTIAFSEL